MHYHKQINLVHKLSQYLAIWVVRRFNGHLNENDLYVVLINDDSLNLTKILNDYLYPKQVLGARLILLVLIPIGFANLLPHSDVWWLNYD